MERRELRPRYGELTSFRSGWPAKGSANGVAHGSAGSGTANGAVGLCTVDERLTSRTGGPYGAPEPLFSASRGNGCSAALGVVSLPLDGAVDG